MPSIQDLNAFKNAINQLGNEPEIAQSRNEELENIQPGEEGVPLMPELSASYETIEQEQLADEEESEEAVLDPDNIVMSDVIPGEERAEELENPNQDLTQNEEEPDYALPKEFDELLNSLQDNAIPEPAEPEAAAGTGLSDLQSDNVGNDALDTDALLQEEEVAPGSEQDTATEIDLGIEASAETEIPPSAFQMLDTGFDGLDSERLSSDLLGEELAAEEADEPLPVSDLLSEDGQQEALDEPMLPAAQQGQEEQEEGTTEEGEGETEKDFPADLEALEPGGNAVDLPAEPLAPEFDELLAQQDGESDEIMAADLGEFKNADEMAGESDSVETLSPLDSTAKSVLDNIVRLEKALQQHRSDLDLLHLSEDEFVEEDGERGELEFTISPENAHDFLLQLSTYPIALKLAIQGEIGENGLNEEAVETLVEMVGSGANPRHVANYFFSQTGKRISLPKGYRYHAIDRDNLNLRFHRQFAQIGFPLIRRMILGALMLAVVVWLPFYYIYRPTQAYLYYRQGYNEILNDNFNNAERYFTLGTNGWPLFNDSVFVKGWPYKSWFLSYGEAYASRKDFDEATFKLRETLRYYPDYRKAWFRYITLLSKQMGRYPQAEEVIQQYNNRFGRDYKSLILRGQNYLYWGDLIPSYYEEARQIFGATYYSSSKDDLPLLYLLDCYIRTAPYSNNEAELQKLTSFFIESDPNTLDVPSDLYARILSKTADYYLTRNNVDVAKKLLLNVSQIKDNSMEVYRSLARYYDIVRELDKELESLNMSLFFLNHRDDRNTTPNLLEQLSLTMQRANFVVNNNDEALATSFVLNDLMIQLQKVQRRRLGENQDKAADIYAMFGDFYYENLPMALNSIHYYREASSLGLDNPAINYRYGYLLYQQGDFKQAVERFLKSQVSSQSNNKVQYALGNSLLQAGNYNSAQGVMEEAYTSLQEELRQSFLLDPQFSKEARDRLFMLVRLANDIGVSYYEETLQSPNLANEDTAMAYMLQAMGYLDILGREDTLSLKLPPGLLFRPRLLTKNTVDQLENSIAARGLVLGSLPDRNFKEVLENKVSAPSSEQQVDAYWMDIQDPHTLEETMDY